MTQEQDAVDAKRYRWLRDNPRKSKHKSIPSYAPRAMNMISVKPYAGNGAQLDADIDLDILNDAAQCIYETLLAEGGERFSDHLYKFSDEFARECEERAKILLSTGSLEEALK